MKSRVINLNSCTGGDIVEAAEAFKNGRVCVFATDTVYGIGSGALTAVARRRVYEIKKRDFGKPFQILVPDIYCALSLGEFNGAAHKLAETFWPGALTLLLKPSAKGEKYNAGFEKIGLRVPNFGPLVSLMRLAETPVFSTSANISGKENIVKEEEIIKTFNGVADYIITCGDAFGGESAVIDAAGSNIKVLRLGALEREKIDNALL